MNYADSYFDCSPPDGPSDAALEAMRAERDDAIAAVATDKFVADWIASHPTAADYIRDIVRTPDEGELLSSAVALRNAFAESNRMRIDMAVAGRRA